MQSKVRGSSWKCADDRHLHKVLCVTRCSLPFSFYTVTLNVTCVLVTCATESALVFCPFDWGSPLPQTQQLHHVSKAWYDTCFFPAAEKFTFAKCHLTGSRWKLFSPEMQWFFFLLNSSSYVNYQAFMTFCCFWHEGYKEKKMTAYLTPHTAEILINTAQNSFNVCRQSPICPVHLLQF